MHSHGTIAEDRLKELEGNVLITGGAGFLGRATLRRAERENWPAKFTVLSRDEEKLWKVGQRWPDVRTVIGDVKNRDHLRSVMLGHDTVLHYAAVKFIPEAEFNVLQTIETNVDGSRNVLYAAAETGVDRVVMVSTDKACQPVNTYGFTKALMERMAAEATKWMGPEVTAVRYGNVVGSTGSIIPVFREQVKQWGEIRVTDFGMTRFWLSVDEAIDLVLLALAQGESHPGAVFVPRCGAMKIEEIAKIVAAEQHPKSVRIRETGIRPGEKMNEDLVHYQEAPRTELYGDYFAIGPATETGQGKGYTYSSHSPAFWIDPARMTAMIEDARSV